MVYNIVGVWMRDWGFLEFVVSFYSLFGRCFRLERDLGLDKWRKEGVWGVIFDGFFWYLCMWIFYIYVYKVNWWKIFFNKIFVEVCGIEVL